MCCVYRIGRAAPGHAAVSAMRAEIMHIAAVLIEFYVYGCLFMASNSGDIADRNHLHMGELKNPDMDRLIYLYRLIYSYKLIDLYSYM